VGDARVNVGDARVNVGDARVNPQHANRVNIPPNLHGISDIFMGFDP